MCLTLTVHDRARSGSIKVQAYNTLPVRRGSIFRSPVFAHQGRLGGALYHTMASTPAVTMHDSEVHSPPLHWIPNGEQNSPNYHGTLLQKVVLVIHRTLCLITFGEPSLRPIWERSHCGDAKVWEQGRNSLRERIQHTNIVVSFIDFQRGGTLLDFRRAVYFSPRSRLSAAPIHLQIPSSFHTLKKVPRVSYS